jgi:phage-related minor tail protein
VKEEFGKELIPIAIDLMKALIPILKWLSDLPKPVKDAILVFMGLAAAIGPVLLVLGSVVSTVGGLVALAVYGSILHIFKAR